MSLLGGLGLDLRQHHTISRDADGTVQSAMFFVPRLIWGTEKVPQRNYVTKILPNVRVNFLVRFASNPLFYWVMAGNPFGLFRKFFGAVRAISECFWLLSFGAKPGAGLPMRGNVGP